MTPRLALAAMVVLVPALRAQESLAIAQVGVVDVVSGTILPDRLVVVAGQRIQSVAPGATPIPVGARLINGRGKYLIPGLWDMHVHLSYARPSVLPALIANGVTYVRDLGSRLAEIDEWRGRIPAGHLSGPMILRAGPILNGQEFNRYQLAITNGPDARATVRALEKAGVDLIKVHRRTPREAYFAVVEETKRLSLPLAGHIPMTVTPAEASRAGQSTIEHAITLFEGTFATDRKNEPLPEAIRRWRTTAAAQELFTTFVQNGTVVNPTLVTDRRLIAWLENPVDPRDKYLAASGQREAAALLAPMRRDAAKHVAERRALLLELDAVVGQMHRAGVRLVTGTDLSNVLLHPGFSLHDELKALVDAGLTPAQAIRAATLNPAQLFPKLGAGEVAAGRLANLVLLDANPLDAIANVARIHGVVLGGRFYDRAALDGLLATAVAEAAVN